MSDLFPGDFAAAETGIFWDIEECKIPDELNAGEVMEKIRSTISSAGHHGTVSIRAYGDMTGHDFPSEGIKLNHFPAGARYARHTKILEDIISWAAEHPQPSNLMLIIGDTSDDFVEVVELLKSKKNYRFLLVQPLEWVWKCLVVNRVYHDSTTCWKLINVLETFSQCANCSNLTAMLGC